MFVVNEAMNPALQGHPRQVIVKSSDKLWPTGGGNGKPLLYSCLENSMNSMKRQKDMKLEDAPPRSESVQYAPGEEQRAITNSSRKNETGTTLSCILLFVTLWIVVHQPPLIHGILQARILEWVAIPFSRGSS